MTRVIPWPIPVIRLTAWILLGGGFTTSGALKAADGDRRLSDSMVTVLMAIPESSEKYCDARCRLADHFLDINTMAGRQKAEEYARQAVTNNPRDLPARLTLVRALYARGYFYAAGEACRDILNGFDWNQPPSAFYADAYFFLGLVEERSALKYKDMIGLVESSAGNQYVSLAAYGYEDLNQAADHFENALQHQPAHREALLHLALLYMEVARYDAMWRLTQWRLERNPFDKDACLYAAYAAYHLGRTGESRIYFERAFQQMSREEFDQYHDTDGILSGPDPMFLTTENEKELERFNRVTYANLRFRRDRSDAPGIESEQGRLYLKYGRPDVSYAVQPDIGLLGGARVWSYDGFVLNFRDDYANGHFLLDNASVLEADNLRHTIPDRFQWPTGMTFDVNVRTYQFKSPDGQSRIVIFAETVPSDSATFAGRGGLFLTDSSDVPVRDTLVDIPAATGEDRIAVLGIHSPVDPRIKGFSLEFRSNATFRHAVIRGPMVIRDFSRDSLQLSDVIVGRLSKGKTVIPIFGDTIVTTDPIQIYFEAYHLALDDDGRSRFRVETSISSMHRNFWGRLTGPSDWYRVTSSTVMSGASTDDRVSLGLDLSRLVPGSYQLDVVVRDLHTQEEAAFRSTMVLTVR